MPAPVRLLLRLARTDLTTKTRRAQARLRATTTDVARMNLVRVNAKWHRELLAHDPSIDLGRVTVPVLALTGGKDLQVPAADVPTDVPEAGLPGRLAVPHRHRRPADHVAERVGDDPVAQRRSVDVRTHG